MTEEGKQKPQSQKEDAEYEAIVKEELKKPLPRRRKQVNQYQACLALGGMGFGGYLIKE